MGLCISIGTLYFLIGKNRPEIHIYYAKNPPGLHIYSESNIIHQV
jgi:hypothetical protein